MWLQRGEVRKGKPVVGPAESSAKCSQMDKAGDGRGRGACVEAAGVMAGSAVGRHRHRRGSTCLASRAERTAVRKAVPGCQAVLLLLQHVGAWTG